MATRRPVDDVTVRAFRPADRPTIVAGRDGEWARWLGPGSPEPAPTAVIVVAGVVVGWVDVDAGPAWLGPGEVNVGYCVFPEHRGHGYAARAVRLVLVERAGPDTRRALLVIDAANTASRSVARQAGARLVVGRVVPELAGSLVFAIDLDGPQRAGGEGARVPGQPARRRPTTK